MEICEKSMNKLAELAFSDEHQDRKPRAVVAVIVAVDDQDKIHQARYVLGGIMKKEVSGVVAVLTEGCFAVASHLCESLKKHIAKEEEQNA